MCNTLLQGLLKMKLSSGKLQIWEQKKPPVGAATFCPSPILVFDIPPCRKCLPVSEAGHFAVLMQENFVKGKLPEIHLIGRGDPGLRHF
jgi:hypothetical protein